MIEKLEWKNFPGEIYTRGPGNIELGEKINEIIDYLNKQEKVNSYRVNWTYQDTKTGGVQK